MSSSDADRASQRVDVLGVGVSAINMDDALEVIDQWITAGRREYVCTTDVHGVMASRRDETLRRVHAAAGLVTPGGMPLVWLSRWRGFRATARVYGPDLMLAVCERSLSAGYRHFFYGGGPGVPERLAQRLQKRFPGLVVAGTWPALSGPVRDEEREQLVALINDGRPDIVWVGLGTPAQDHWMAEQIDCLAATVLVGVGAAFDVHAGLQPGVPRWMRRSGLEWLFRMAREPRRLGRRYLVDNPLFVGLVLLQMWQGRSVLAHSEFDDNQASVEGIKAERKVV